MRAVLTLPMLAFKASLFTPPVFVLGTSGGGMDAVRGVIKTCSVI